MVYSIDHATSSDESSRLLPPSNQTERTPLPKTQLGVLIALRIACHLAYNQTTPYINQFLVYLHIAESNGVGFYSGLMETTYSIAMVLSVYHWGWVSDIVGRRPVVVISLIGVAATTIAFGMSTSLLGILVSKFVCGFLEGNTAVIHSFLAEIADETNQDLVIPIYSLAWPVSSVLGPLIGGTLENAATRYPEHFSWRLFIDHPYLPPCLVSALCALAGAGLGFVFMEETLPSKRRDTTGENSSHCSASGSHTTQGDAARAMGVSELLSVPAIRALAISGFALNFLSVAFDVVFILFCYSAVESGGLGLEPSTIASFLAFGGVLSVVRFFTMPYILHHFDYAKTYRVCMSILPFSFAALPILNAIAHYRVFGTEARTAAAVWIGLGIVLSLSKATGMAYSVGMLLMKQYAPTPSSLGQSNGIMELAMSIGSAVGPVLVNTLFTVCNGSEWARKYGLAWTWAGVMVCLSLAGARVTKELENWSRETPLRH